MFGLLQNLYKYLKEKAERKICLVILGVDNAGKTTLLNTVQGELVRLGVLRAEETWHMLAS